MIALEVETKWISKVILPRVELDYLEAGYLLGLAVFLVASWTSFTLAELGLDRPVVVLVLAAGAGTVGAILVLRRPWRRVGLGSLAGLAPSLLAGLVLYFPPDEWILGGLDPGSYASAGAAIARTGAIVQRIPAFGQFDASTRAALVVDGTSRLPGIYLAHAVFDGLHLVGVALSADREVPHGFHLYPAVLAFGYALGGVRPELLVTPILALAGLGGFYLLVRRLFGTGVAALATLFLAVNPAQVWFARYPAAEILAAVLLFGGFLAFVAMLDAPNRWLALLAGGALGAVHLTKIELLALPFLIAAYLAFQAAVGRFERPWLWFVAAYALVLLQAIVHAVTIASFYTVATLVTTVSPRLLAALVAVGLVGGGVTIFLACFPARSRRVRSALGGATWRRAWSLGLPFVIGILAVYAYYIRPQNTAIGPTWAMDSLQIYVQNNLQSFLRLGWYVSPLGVLLGSLGWMWLAHDALNRRTALLFMVIAADTVLFLQDMRITPGHFWAARRWVDLVIPGFCLAAAYLLVKLTPRDRQRWFEASLPVGLAFVMLVGIVGGTRPLVHYVEYRGAVEQVQALATRVPADGVVVFVDGDLGRRISLPVDYIFGRTALIMPDDAAGRQAMTVAVRKLLAEGRPVYWVTTPLLPDPTALGFASEPVYHDIVSLAEKPATYDSRPGFQDATFVQGYVMWRLTASPSVPGA